MNNEIKHSTDPCKIIGIVVVKNEDMYVERAVLNSLDFCDHMIIAENYSEDRTYDIVRTLAEQHPKISLHRIKKLQQAHQLIEAFAGTNTWFFSVDGDEIYDPSGLIEMRQRLQHGEFDGQWLILGNVLHCTDIDEASKTAKGYLAPPARPMTKLYNFSLIKNWKDCPFVLSGGTTTFKEGYHSGLRYDLGKKISWEDAYFRCLHTVFMKRSSLERHSWLFNTRLNARETLQLKKVRAKGRVFRLLSEVRRNMKMAFRKDWKNQRYKSGARVQKDVSVFFPEEQ